MTSELSLFYSQEGKLNAIKSYKKYDIRQEESLDNPILFSLSEKLIADRQAFAKVYVIIRILLPFS